jgi:hypothetical protein
MSSIDIELASQNVVSTRGFARVAAKINSDIDKTTTIYRRFDELAARNLLFYQAELAELEEQQRCLDDEDSNATDMPSIECQRDWEKFAAAANTNDVADTSKQRELKKMELAMKIREKLEKYRKCLEQLRAMNATDFLSRRST